MNCDCKVRAHSGVYQSYCCAFINFESHTLPHTCCRQIADCSCQKQCLCRSKGAGTVSPPRFQQLSADREEVDAVEHLVEDGGQMSILPG